MKNLIGFLNKGLISWGKKRNWEKKQRGKKAFLRSTEIKNLIQALFHLCVKPPPSLPSLNGFKGYVKKQWSQPHYLLGTRVITSSPVSFYPLFPTHSVSWVMGKDLSENTWCTTVGYASDSTVSESSNSCTTIPEEKKPLHSIFRYSFHSLAAQLTSPFSWNGKFSLCFEIYFLKDRKLWCVAILLQGKSQLSVF